MKVDNQNSNDILTDEECFKHLFYTFVHSMNDNESKREDFKSFASDLIHQGIINGYRTDCYAVNLMFDYRRITKCEIHELISQTYLKYFSEQISFSNYVKIGCSLFYHGDRSVNSIYDTVRKYHNRRQVARM
jgi:hypothetical protein